MCQLLWIILVGTRLILLGKASICTLIFCPTECLQQKKVSARIRLLLHTLGRLKYGNLCVKLTHYCVFSFTFAIIARNLLRMFPWVANHIYFIGMCYHSLTIVHFRVPYTNDAKLTNFNTLPASLSNNKKIFVSLYCTLWSL